MLWGFFIFYFCLNHLPFALSIQLSDCKSSPVPFFPSKWDHLGLLELGRGEPEALSRPSAALTPHLCPGSSTSRCRPVSVSRGFSSSHPDQPQAQGSEVWGTGTGWGRPWGCGGAERRRFTVKTQTTAGL